MKRDDLFTEIKNIMISIFDNETITIEEKTTANEVEEWDSLTHIELVVALEKKFNIRFTSKEIQSWSNVGEIADCISSKINQ